MHKILMCDPEYFRVDYVINPWMKKGSVDSARAQEQWQHLKETYESLGVVVEVMPASPVYPDMVFIADQGVVHGTHMIVSKFRYAERQGESIHAAAWFASHGFTVEQSNVAFEGGEIISCGDSYLVGTGFRTESGAIPFLQKKLRKKIVELSLIDERFYHLDTCLFVLDASTAFYYPPAFAPESIAWLKENISHLIVLGKEDAFGFAANSVVVGKHVICQVGNMKFFEQLKRCGYIPLPLDVGEYIKSGGGVHCLTLPLS